MNILICNSGRRWIGEVGHCAQLYEALTARGHHVWLACRKGSELQREAKRRELRVVSMNFESRFSPFKELRDFSALRRVIRRRAIDVVHVHRGKDHWTGAIAARTAGVPIVRTRHVVTPVHSHWPNRWLLARMTDAVISVSQAAEASFGELTPLIVRRRVILSAVDADLFNPARRSEAWQSEFEQAQTGDGEAGRSEAGTQAAVAQDPKGGEPEQAEVGEPEQAAKAGEPVWFGLVGRIQRIKGQKVFLEAARAVAAECPEARFLVAGRGIGKRIGNYRRLARRYGLEGKVRFEGVMANLPEAMASLDVGVVASIGSEGSSRVTLEYMASGLPVVATRVGGIPDLLAPEWGILVTPDKPRPLAQAMIELATDAERRHAMGRAARQRAEEFHSPDRWAGEIESVYREVLRAK